MVHLKIDLYQISIRIKFLNRIPKPNKSGGSSTTTGCAGVERAATEVAGSWIVGVACRTGFLVVTGDANGFNFGMLLLPFFST